MVFRLGDREDGTINMARDAALLDEVGRNGIAARVYDWSAPWITLGKFQNPSQDLRPDCPLPSIKRPSGGRAVLHGHDLTIGLAISLSLIAESGEDVALLSRSVRKVYRFAVQPIIASLKACGIEAALGEQIKGLAHGPKSADCFAHISANDVIDQKTLKKACGVALLLTQEAVLLQASIPIRQPLVDPATVYSSPAKVYPLHLTIADFGNAFESALSKFESCNS